MSTRLVLASASPRRSELLRAAGFEFDVIPAELNEAIDPEETPAGYVRRLAQLKAQAVARQARGRPVLGADTVVVVDNDVLGKPTGEDDARRMLWLLSGRGHVVMTAVCLINQVGSSDETGPVVPRGPGETGQAPSLEPRRLQTDVARTTVEFAPLSGQEIDWYVSTGEPMDKAGGYAIQGLASRFVTRIDGSYSNVVGLPVAVAYALCKRAGLLVS